MKKVHFILLIFLPIISFGQTDSTAFSKENLRRISDSIEMPVNSIKLHLDSLREVMQIERDAKAPPGVVPYNGSTGKDTAFVVLETPMLNFNESSEAPLKLVTDYGRVLLSSKDFHNYYEAYFSDVLKADLYVVILNKEGARCFGGFWRPSGFISDVIEYDNGAPVRSWEKSYGEFKIKE